MPMKVIVKDIVQDVSAGFNQNWDKTTWVLSQCVIGIPLQGLNPYKLIENLQQYVWFLHEGPLVKPQVPDGLEPTV